MKKFYAGYCLFIFISTFLLVFPLFALFIETKQKARAHWVNKLWGKLVFVLCFLPHTRIKNFKPEKGKTYVYVSNHTSYIDIPLLFLTVPGYFSIIGKHSLTKVPLFGYMYRNLYISVDRRSKKGRYHSLEASREVLRTGRSLVIFPEGTIPRENKPHMISYKDGAFKLAIEFQIPIVPISIPFNWKVLPDNTKLNVNWHPIKIVVHEPIETKGMSMDDMNELKQKTFGIINESILTHNKL